MRSCRVLSKSHTPDELLCAQLEIGALASAHGAVLRAHAVTIVNPVVQGTSHVCCCLVVSVFSWFPSCRWDLRTIGGLANPIFFTIHLLAQQVFVESLLGAGRLLSTVAGAAGARKPASVSACVPVEGQGL